MKRIIRNIFSPAGQPGLFPVWVYVVLCVVFHADALPVVSDLSIIAGERGVAVSITSDGPFKATFSGNGKTARMLLSGCVYGLSEFSYSDFPPASPIRSITAREISSGTTDISVVLKQSLTLPVKAVQKKNQWMALLSENAVSQYKWSAATAAPPAKQTAEEAPVPSATAATAQPREEKPAAGGTLRNIRLLQRGQICELAFEFDKEVTSSIRKKGNTVVFTAENITNGTGSNLLTLPARSVFRKIAITQRGVAGAPLLNTVITIDTALAESNFNVAFTRGTVLSFFLMQRKQQKATLWTSGHGLAWNYQFYDVPSYNIDLETIGSKARRDAQQQLSPNQTFAIKETPARPKQTADTPQPETVPADDTPAPPPPEVVIAPEETTATMVVITDRVNIRGTPSLKGNITGKLQQGDTVYVVNTSDKWYKIHSKEARGFIFSSLVRSVDMAIAVPSTIAINNNSPEVSATPSAPATPSVTQVSTTVSSDSPLPSPSPSVNSRDEVNSKAKKGIRYTGVGRDPFEPIVPSSVSASGLPFAENLHLVGILYDDADRIALCEDTHNDNQPFALREHDAVEKGKVLKIYQDKVVFLITEFGISRSFTLQLSKATDEQEVSKK